MIQEAGGIWFGQPVYTAQLLKAFGMTECKPVATPSDKDTSLLKAKEGDECIDQNEYQAAVGGLLYLSTKTRPDISFAVGNVARFCSHPTQVHWTPIKRIMRYLRGTQDLGIQFIGDHEQQKCVGYSDSDWGGS